VRTSGGWSACGATLDMASGSAVAWACLNGFPGPGRADGRPRLLAILAESNATPTPLLR
jgi:hypothetical protein